MAVKWSSGYTTQYGAVLYVGAETYVSGSSVKIVVYWKLASGSSLYVSHARLAVSGSTSYSAEVAINGAGTASRWLWERTITVSRQYGSVVNGSFTVTLSGYGGSTTVTVPYSVPALPYNTPAQPTNFRAQRVSDRKFNLSWSASSTQAAPIQDFRFAKRINNSSWQYSILSASACSYVDSTGAAPDSKIDYALQTRNQNKQSDYVFIYNMYTTPAAPSGLTVSRDGLNVVLKWVNNAKYAKQIEIWDSDVLLATVDSVSSYTDVSPNPSISHSYKVRTVIDGVYSDYSESENITLLTPPLAPTSLSPNGGYMPVVASHKFSWVHNSVDGSSQTDFKLQVRVSADSEWLDLDLSENDEVSLPSEENSRISIVRVSTAPTRNYAYISVEGYEGQLQWRVATKGDHDEYSPWSTLALVNVVAPPTLIVNTPKTGETITSNTVTTSITTSDDALYSWTAILYSSDSETPVATNKGVKPKGTTHAETVFKNLKNGSSYTISWTITGLVESMNSDKSFTVKYAAPRELTATGKINMSMGGLTFKIEDTGEDGEDVERFALYRYDTNNDSRELISDGVSLPTNIPVPIPVFDGSTEYQIVSYSALGEVAYGKIVLPSQAEIARLNNIVWINWGARDEFALGLIYNIDCELQPAREYVKDYFFAGATKPVVVAGKQIRRTLTLSAYLGCPNRPLPYTDGTIRPTLEIVQSLWDLAQTASLVTVRAPDYPILKGYLSGFSMPRDETNSYTVSLTVTEAN